MSLVRKVPLDPGLTFICQRNIFLAIAALITVASVAITIVQGLNFGGDFRGGLLLEARLAQPADLGELRNRLGDLGLGDVTLRSEARSVGEECVSTSRSRSSRYH